MSKITIGIPDAVATESLSYADTDMTLREIATDLHEAHRELDQYYSGSLALAQNLKELRHSAEAAGNTELTETTRNLEQSAMAIVERTQE